MVVVGESLTYQPLHIPTANEFYFVKPSPNRIANPSSEQVNRIGTFSAEIESDGDIGFEHFAKYYSLMARMGDIRTMQMLEEQYQNEDGYFTFYRTQIAFLQIKASGIMNSACNSIETKLPGKSGFLAQIVRNKYQQYLQIQSEITRLQEKINNGEEIYGAEQQENVISFIQLLADWHTNEDVTYHS